ncbi:hypothetical protein [Aestuariivirga sp.]|uniref:hypothetical protein n=1 Tax=Aestuariivirga sp. TaxID=2650926 RepID=UPI00391B7484
MSRILTALAAAAAGMIAAAPAHAASLDFDILTNQFSKPAMHFDYKDGKFVWDRKPITTGFRARGSIDRGYEWDQYVTLAPNGKGGKPLSGRMPYKDRSFTHADSITFPASFLAAYTAGFAKFCARNAGPEKKVSHDLSATFTFIRGYHPRNEPPEVGGSGGLKVTKAVTMPMSVSCAAIPKRVPSEALKVTELKLYTSPATPRCGKPFRLVAEFHTNKPGKVNFTLHRHDGERQNASVEVGQVQGGFAKRWFKDYLYNKSIERSYKVSVKGQELPAQWVPVKVDCGAKDEQKPADALTD